MHVLTASKERVAAMPHNEKLAEMVAKADSEEAERTAAMNLRAFSIPLVSLTSFIASLDTGHKYYDEDEADDLIKALRSLLDFTDKASEYISKLLGADGVIYYNLTGDIVGLSGTKSRFGSIESELSVVTERVKAWRNQIDDIAEHVEWKKGQVGKSDDNHTGSSSNRNYNTLNLNPSYAAASTIGAVTVQNVELFNALVGTVLINGTAILYTDTIGGKKVESSPTASYGLLGIQKLGDVYYYRMIDKATGQVYFTEFNNNITIQTNYKNLLEINKPTAMLDSTEIGTDNFKKLADENTLYFVSGQKEDKGINFVNVLDPTDGKSYYVALSDSNQEIAISSIIKVGNEEVV